MFGIAITTVLAIEQTATTLWRRFCGGKLPVSTRDIISSHGILLNHLSNASPFEAVFDLSDKPPYELLLKPRRIDQHEVAYRRRSRFTQAHELGHFFLHRDVRMVHREDFNTVVEAARGNYKLADREHDANCFAAALLMPREPFESDLRGSGFQGGEDWIRRMASKYDVSYSAIVIRLARMRSGLVLSGHAWADSGKIRSLIPTLELELAYPGIAKEAWRCNPQVCNHVVREIPLSFLTEIRSQVRALPENDVAATKMTADNVRLEDFLSGIGNNLRGNIFICGCNSDGRMIFFEMEL